MIIRLPGEYLKKVIKFLSYCPLQIWAIKTCNQKISKIIIASSFKHGQLVEDDKKITWCTFEKKNFF